MIPHTSGPEAPQSNCCRRKLDSPNQRAATYGARTSDRRHRSIAASSQRQLKAGACYRGKGADITRRGICPPPPQKKKKNTVNLVLSPQGHLRHGHQTAQRLTGLLKRIGPNQALNCHQPCPKSHEEILVKSILFPGKGWGNLTHAPTHYGIRYTLHLPGRRSRPTVQGP